MRVWELTDSQAFSASPVREQDFILRLRRLHRLGTAHVIFNICLSALGNQGTLDFSHRQSALEEFARLTHGEWVAMTNGDAFIVWEDGADGDLLLDQALTHLGLSSSPDDTTLPIILPFHLPDDYLKIRERINDYIEALRAQSAMAVLKKPTEALRTEAARGPLTAWGVDQIGRLLDEIDVQNFGRSQIIYRYHTDGSWSSAQEEHYIGFEDLRRDHFPALDVATPEHLFLTLCEILDQKLLQSLCEQPDFNPNRPYNLNLSVASVMGAVFARFTHKIPRDKRSLIGFELHRGDWLQDFTITLNAIQTLRQEGYRIILDGITPNMLGFMNPSAIDADSYKINVSRDHLPCMSKPEFAKELSRIPSEKIIFCHTDTEKAVTIGRQHGITFFQGWYIDDLIQAKT